MHTLLPIWILAIPFLLSLVALVRAPRATSPLRQGRPAGATASVPQSLTAAVPEDVVGYLERQHAEIKTLFAETLAASPVDRPALFLSLRRLMATHEALEEELIHPEAQRLMGERGRAILLERFTEERVAATRITEIERLQVDSMQFEMELGKLKADVELHAAREEAEEFPALSGMSADRLQRVRHVVHDLYTKDLRSTPAGQHPSRDIGPFVAMLNHARDVLAGNRTLEGFANEGPATS